MSHRKQSCDIITASSSLTLYHSGPPLSIGPLPTFFYFALSGEDSLALDPYNQPVINLSNSPIRIFSLSLPGHGIGLDNNLAMGFWIQQFVEGVDIIGDFITRCREALDFIIDHSYANPSQIAAAGLSRGAFIATHFAAADSRIKTILGFAPLTQLEAIEEFNVHASEHPLIKDLSLFNLIDKLIDKRLRFYIGNRDTRVGTERCFAFIHALTEACYVHKHRSPPIELIIYPSVGFKGHGTPPHIFHDGTNWLNEVN